MSRLQPTKNSSLGINYALNWALATDGIFPHGKTYHNLDDANLKSHAAVFTGLPSETMVYACGTSKGAVGVTKMQFKQIANEIKSHLSRSTRIYVHDGAVSVSPSFGIKVRSISDHPFAAMNLRHVLCDTSLDDISADAFPISLYISTEYWPSSAEELGCTYRTSGLIFADFEFSTLVICGRAYRDTVALRSAIFSTVSPLIVQHGALPLAARLVSLRESAVLVAGPEAVFQTSSVLLQASLSPHAGVCWHASGVTSCFSQKLIPGPCSKLPTSFVLITLDRTGTIPAISKLKPSQTAIHFLAGYCDNKFLPTYNEGPLSVDPVVLAMKLSSTLTAFSTPSFLVNASWGETLLPEEDLLKLLGSSLSQTLPKNKRRKPCEGTVNNLKSRYVDFMSKAFPKLPESISV